MKEKESKEVYEDADGKKAEGGNDVVIFELKKSKVFRIVYLEFFILHP